MTFETKKIGYFAHVTEIEFGWGTRPDGVVIAGSKEGIEKLRQVFNTTKSNYAYNTIGEILQFEPNHRAESTLGERDYVWCNENNVTKYGTRL